MFDPRISSWRNLGPIDGLNCGLVEAEAIAQVPEWPIPHDYRGAPAALIGWHE